MKYTIYNIFILNYITFGRYEKMFNANLMNEENVFNSWIRKPRTRV